jgi:hypothetical protein
LEEVAMHVDHEDLVEFDDNNLAIVGNPKGIFTSSSGLTQ